MTRRQARPALAVARVLQREVNQLFERLSILDRSDRLPGSEWCAGVDVFELRERLIVIVEVPGLAPDSLKVVCRERELVLSGERRAPRVGQGARFLCLERPHGPLRAHDPDRRARWTCARPSAALEVGS